MQSGSDSLTNTATALLGNKSTEVEAHLHAQTHTQALTVSLSQLPLLGIRMVLSLIPLFSFFPFFSAQRGEQCSCEAGTADSKFSLSLRRVKRQSISLIPCYLSLCSKTYQVSNFINALRQALTTLSWKKNTSALRYKHRP